MLNKNNFNELMKLIDYSMTKKEIIKVLKDEKALQELIFQYNIQPSKSLESALRQHFSSLQFGYDFDFEIVKTSFKTFHLKGIHRYEEMKRLLPFHLEIDYRTMKTKWSMFDKVFKSIKKVNPLFDFEDSLDEELL